MQSRFLNQTKNAFENFQAHFKTKSIYNLIYYFKYSCFFTSNSSSVIIPDSFNLFNSTSNSNFVLSLLKLSKTLYFSTLFILFLLDLSSTLSSKSAGKKNFFQLNFPPSFATIHIKRQKQLKTRITIVNIK